MNTSGDSGSPETEVISFFRFLLRPLVQTLQTSYSQHCQTKWIWQLEELSSQQLEIFQLLTRTVLFWQITLKCHLQFTFILPLWSFQQPYIPLLQTQFQWWHQMAPKKLVSWRGRIWTFSSCWSAGSSDVYFALHRRPHFVQRSHHCHIHFEWTRDCVLPTNKKRFWRNCCRYAYQSNPHRLLVFYLCHRWLWRHWLLSIIRSSHHTPFSKFTHVVS